MALLKSAQSGNWDSASTWNVCTAVYDGTATHATSVAPTAPTWLGTVNSVAPYNSTFNALGLAIKICGRAAILTGTISVQLAGIAGTLVTVNLSDVISQSIPTTASTIFAQWIYFKFDAPVTISNGTTLTPQVQTSNASTVTVARVGTTVLQSFVVTAGTKAPAVTDTFSIIGDNSNSGKGSAIEVIMNNITTTLYGPATPIAIQGAYALYIGDNATLTYGTAESTSYLLRVSGHVAIGAGGAAYPGTLNIGTTTTPMPRTSTATLEIVGGVISATVGSVLCVYGGRLITQGQSRTVGKNVDRCLLTANAAIGATSLTVDTDTGWLSGDNISVAPTARVSGTGLSEHTLTANATANTLTISPAIATSIREGGANAVQAEVILIARNVVIKSSNPGTTNIWMEISGSTAIVDCDWTRFSGFGSAITNRIGIYLGTIGGAGAPLAIVPPNITFNNCMFQQNISNFISSTTGGGAVVTDCTFTSSSATGGTAFTFSAIGSGTSITNTWCANLANATTVSIRDYFPITGLRICCSGGGALLFNAPQATTISTPGQLLISNTYIKCANPGIALSGTVPTVFDWSTPLVFDNIEVTRCAGAGLNMGGLSGFIFDNFKIWTNSTQNISNTTVYSGNVIFRNGYIATQTGATVAAGISSSIAGGKATFENCSFGTGLPTAVPHTQDILPSAAANQGMNIILRNCILASATEVATPLIESISVISENHDQNPGNKKIWLKRGTVTTDTTPPRLVHDGSRSIRLQPNSASFAMDYVVARVAVASGSTPTLGIYVRKSSLASGDTTDYALGSQPRLIVKRNVNVGITSDTVLATASAANGVWELLSGTLPTLTGDGIIEVEVDCAASAGWVNIDSFQAPSAVNTKGLEISDDTLGVGAYGDNSAGGGSPVTVGYAFVG